MMMNRRTLLNTHNDTIINGYNGLLGRMHITVFGHIVGLRMDYCQKIYKLCFYFGICSSKLYKLAHRFMVHLKFTICIWLNSIEPKKSPHATARNYQSHADGSNPKKGFITSVRHLQREGKGRGPPAGEKVQVKLSCSVTTDQSPT